MEKINSVLVRYGEIGIKGQNRSFFEKMLIKNIKDCLNKNKISYNGVHRYSGRIIINTNDKCLVLKNVFGISSFSPAIKTESNLDKIKKLALELYTKGTFRISAKRLNKKFPIESGELNKQLGDYISKNKNAKVNLIKPDCNIAVEIMDYAYLFNERYEGLNGLPVGVEGKVTLILENEKDLLAGLLMMKRGCFLEIINKNNLNFSILEKYCYGSRINLVNKMSQDSLALVKTNDLENIKNKINNEIVLNPLVTDEKGLINIFKL